MKSLLSEVHLEMHCSGVLLTGYGIRCGSVDCCGRLNRGWLAIQSGGGSSVLITQVLCWWRALQRQQDKSSAWYMNCSLTDMYEELSMLIIMFSVDPLLYTIVCTSCMWMLRIRSYILVRTSCMWTRSYILVRTSCMWRLWTRSYIL